MKPGKLQRLELFKVIESFCKLAANVPIKYFYHIRKSRLDVNKPKDKKFFAQTCFLLSKVIAAISSFFYTEIFTLLWKYNKFYRSQNRCSSFHKQHSQFSLVFPS